MNVIDIEKWLEIEPYSMAFDQKQKWLSKSLMDLTQHHRKRCKQYARLLNVHQALTAEAEGLEAVPYIPARLFKEFELLSVNQSEIFKTMTSSGTSGQSVSKIFLDRETASLQTKVLSRIMRSLIGKKRLPMLVVDHPSIVKNRQMFSARGAGILGFSMFGQDITYALDNDMRLNLPAIEAFLKRHQHGPIFIFGFTFMIWQYLLVPLLENRNSINLDRGILLHGGGWKKLASANVTNEEFKSKIESLLSINKVVNYYGMVEQTGTLYMECEHGFLHAPAYSDIIVRRPLDFSVAEVGESGLIQTLSILPLSYPGHSILTEDIGYIQGEDDCKCGTLGKYFKVTGRIAKAEVRGCSDTHETR
tara:strand:- start:20080 stop:21165 length:1086 start_codon:yes stop_codon:yes gene_type:complete